MNSWKIILATVVIFAAGVAAGVLLNHSFKEIPPAGMQPSSQNREPQEPPLPPEPKARQMNKDFLKKLDEKLKLTSDQHDKIEKIIADGQERNHELWTNVAPKMRAVMMDVNRQIREQLSADQLKEFEELLKQFHAPRRPKNTNAPGANNSAKLNSVTATNTAR